MYHFHFGVQPDLNGMLTSNGSHLNAYIKLLNAYIIFQLVLEAHSDKSLEAY